MNTTTQTVINWRKLDDVEPAEHQRVVFITRYHTVFSGIFEGFQDRGGMFRTTSSVFTMTEVKAWVPVKEILDSFVGGLDVP